LTKDATLNDLGEKNLKDILLPERIYQLNVPDLPSEFAPLKTNEKIRHNLPTQLSTFIGREKEVAQIKQRLEKNHLVTLTGSGGIGKTRLSIQTAFELLSEYPIGVWLVELAPLTDPALVPQTVCAALGVKPEGGTPETEALINYMREKKILLVVDNCEHLIEACAQLCDTLLHACLQLRIIASSREALGIEGENAYRVPSLSLPDPKSGIKVIEGSEAVKLFMERAAAVLPEFQMTEANAMVIAQICQRLDGIALAIELAASRVKMLKVEQIASRLDDAFRLLTGGSRTALPRQQTLRALIDWSYNLLADDEKIFLLRLSVFMGGWTLEAAEAVCGNADALDLLTHLVDKSLVSVDLEHGDEPRYYLLETVRQYAREKWVESGDGDSTREKHFNFFIEFAEKAEPEVRGFNQLQWLNRLDTEFDNLRAALEWSQNNDPESFLRLASALWRFFSLRGYATDEEWLPYALSITQNLKTKVRARALARAAFNSKYYDPQRGKNWSNEAETLSRSLQDKPSLAQALSSKASFEIDESKRLAILEEALNIATEIGDQWISISILSTRAQTLQSQNNFEEAKQLHLNALQKARSFGDKRAISYLLGILGDLYLERGDALQAEKSFQEGFAYAIDIGDSPNIWGRYMGIVAAKLFMDDLSSADKMMPDGFLFAQNNKQFVCYTFVLSAQVQLAQGNVLYAIEQLREGLVIAIQSTNIFTIGYLKFFLAEALRLKEDFTESALMYRDALSMYQEEKDTSGLYDCFEGLGKLAINQKHPEKGAKLIGAYKKYRDSLQQVDYPYSVRERAINLKNAQTQISEADFNAAWAEGQSMSQEQVLALAMEILQ